MQPSEAVARLGDNAGPGRAARTSTGSLGLDLLTGGWPVGRVSEVYGPAFCGKTTLALSGVPAMQELGTVAYIPLDWDFNPDYARRIGIDTDRLMVIHNSDRLMLIRDWEGLSGFSNRADFVVIDSVNSRELAAPLFHLFGGSTILVVSQVRAALNDPYRSTTGGYFPAAALRVRLTTWHDLCRAEVTGDSRQAQPGITTFMLSEDGIDRADEILHHADRAGLVARDNQGRYYLGRTYLGQGRLSALRTLGPHLGVLEEVLRLGVPGQKNI